MEKWTSLFYAKSQAEVPAQYRSTDPRKTPIIEPDATTLRLSADTAAKNFCAGLIYVCFCFFALIPPSMPTTAPVPSVTHATGSIMESSLSDVVNSAILQKPELVTAVASVVIAVLAFCTSLWQGVVSRRHNRISVRPHLTTWTETKPEEAVYRVELINNGIGPAVIRQFEVKIDGNKVPGAGTQLIESGLKILFPNYTYESYQSYVAEGYVMAKNENRELVRMKFVSENQPTSDAVQKTFERADLLIEYESMYGEKFSLSTEAARLKARNKNSKL